MNHSYALFNVKLIHATFLQASIFFRSFISTTNKTAKKKHFAFGGDSNQPKSQLFAGSQVGCQPAIAFNFESVKKFFF